jgi:predicted RNase H-like nuclease
MPVRVSGVDACRSGWVGVELLDGAVVRGQLAATLTELFPDGSGVQVVGVDMPLGLLESGWRQADLDAARFIGARRSSVFRVPPRAVWDELDFAAANRRCQELTGGVGFSIQTWGLRAKLREANACRDGGVRALYEVHPEVSFRVMAGRPLAHGKKTWAGQAERRTLLARVGIRLPDDLGPAGSAPPDDVLDAAAVAWSAHRIATGQARCLPERPQTDQHGRPIAIWY